MPVLQVGSFNFSCLGGDIKQTLSIQRQQLHCKEAVVKDAAANCRSNVQHSILPQHDSEKAAAPLDRNTRVNTLRRARIFA